MANILLKLKQKKFNLKLLLKYIDEDAVSGKSTLNEVLEVLFNKIDYYEKILEAIIDPSNDMIPLYEVNELSSKDKETAWDSIVKIMRLKRKRDRLTIIHDEKTEIEVLDEALKEWDSLVPEISNILRHMEKVWSNKKGKDIKLNYLG